MSFNQLLFGQRADATSSLVGWWTFDDITGSNAFDSGIGRIPMTMSVTAPTWVVGKIGGGALQFTGSSYIQTPTDPQLLALSGTQSFSEACWFKTTQVPTQSMMGICMSHGGQFDGQYEKGIGITQNGKAGAYTFEAGGANARLMSGSTIINDGNWHHVCAVFNGKTKTYQLYVDGRIENQQAHKATFSYSGTTFLVCSFNFGTGGGLGTWQYFSGSIDDVRIFNRALTVQDIQSLYNYSQPDLTMGLILYYKFDEGSGTVANDSSGNGHTGTYEHSPAFVGGKVGPFALKTSTTNDLVSLSPISMSGNWTIATWTMFPIAVGNHALTRDGAASGSGNVHIYSSAQNLGVYIATDGTPFHTSGYNSTSASVGWHHLAAVGSGNITTFYIDATFVGTASAQATDNLDTIGNNIQSSNQPWGTFDDFRIYNRALAQADIQALYNFR